MTKLTAEMNRSTVHALSPTQSCRDRGRQSFIFHTKRQLGQFARSMLQHEFGKAQIADDTESSVASLDKHPAFAAWSALNIGSQQQMWRALGDMVSRQAPALDEAAKAWNKAAIKGSIELDPELAMPTYFANTAYHGQPGGYCLDRDSDDWYAGALQEAGGTLYSRGAGTGAKDSKGQAVLRFIEATFPGFSPSGLSIWVAVTAVRPVTTSSDFPTQRFMGWIWVQGFYAMPTPAPRHWACLYISSRPARVPPASPMHPSIWW